MSEVIIGKTFKCKRCIGNNCFCRYFKNNCSDISNERCIWKQNFILEQKYDILSKQYNKLLERYQDVLNKAKQSADSFEYCLRDTEQLYEKAVNKLKENGLYNAEEFEVEEE